MSDEKHLTDHWPVAPGHELEQQEWDAVKAYADAWAGRTLEAQASVSIPREVTIAYPGKGGRKDSGRRKRRPQLWVVHTAECPMQTGYAVSLSQWAASGPVQASWNEMGDPATLAHFVPDDRIAWHATVANPISFGVEQAGYAAFSRETWLTPEGRATIEAAAIAYVDGGIPPEAVRYLTDAEVRRALAGDRSVEGLCDHAQIQPRDRTDPGKGYPRDLLIERIRANHPEIPTKEEPLMLTAETITRIANAVANRVVFHAPIKIVNGDGATASVATFLRVMYDRVTGSHEERLAKLEAGQDLILQAISEIDGTSLTVDQAVAEIQAKVESGRVELVIPPDADAEPDEGVNA